MNTLKEKIPMLVNGTLPDGERQAVLDAIDKDPALQKEYQFIKKLRESLRQQPEESPSDLVLAKIKKGIREESRIENTKPQDAISKWWRTGAVAACALLVLQSFILYQDDSVSPGSGDIQLLGENQTADVQVVFADNASFRDIQALLQSVNATIVAGPSALGIVELRFDDSASTVTMLETLKSSEFVVEATLIDN